MMADGAPAARRSSTPRPQERRRPPMIIFRLLNPLFRLLLRSPLHRLLSGQLILLTFTGRRSGRRYTTPVGYAQTGDMLLTGTEGRWKYNLRGGARVSVRLRGRERGGIAEVVDDEAGLLEGYRTILTLAPNYGRAIGLQLGPDGVPNREDVVRAKRDGHVLVRIRLDG